MLILFSIFLISSVCFLKYNIVILMRDSHMWIKPSFFFPFFELIYHFWLFEPTKKIVDQLSVAVHL